MQIEQIEVRNYRVFREVKLANLQPMTVVIGANGTGKSTLFDVFSFLKDALTYDVASAVARRGGFAELVSRDSKGPIEITVKFRESGGRLAAYELAVAFEHGRVFVGREVLGYRRGQGGGRPWHFVDFSKGRGTAITNESVYGKEGAEAERAEYQLDDPSLLAIKGLGQFREFRVVSELRRLIENWHISNDREEARPFFSAVSLWEVAIKRGLGRADFQVDPRVLRRGLLENDYVELAVTGAHAVAVDLLPPIHKDPFDRLLIAQAGVEGLTLVTADRTVARYPGPIRLL